MLEHVSHRNEVGAERSSLETNGAGSAGDVVPTSDFESPSCGSHHLGTIQVDAVVEPLDGREGGAVFEVRADGGSPSETTGPQGADGLLAASCVGRRRTVVLFCGEQDFSIHWARRRGRLSEPSCNALPAKDVHTLAWQLDWRVHRLGIANTACISGVLHWYQTSGEEFCTSRERHVRSA